MRTFELVIIFLDLVILLLRFIPRRLRGAAFLSPILLTVFILHVSVEQPRWQMVPLYGLTLVLFGVELYGLWTGSRAHRLDWTFAGLAILAFFSLPPFLFPVPEMPKPAGRYPVGTVIYEWLDENRDETLAGVPAGKRRLLVQVWYPAEVGSGAEPGPYMNEIETILPAVAKKFGLPTFMLSHLSLVRSHSHFNTPLARTVERFPALVFSHGYGGLRMQNTYQLEELASQGYIVFAPDHTYGAAVTTFLDGTVVLNPPNLLPDGAPDEEYLKAAQKIGDAWAADIRFVFDEIEKLNSGQIVGIFQGRINLDQIGVFGHSTGGGAAAEVCYIDPRCKAGLAMDAWLVPYDRLMTEQGLKAPFFFMQSESWPHGPNTTLLLSLYKNMKAPAWRLTIAGANHYDFTDISLLTPLAPALGIKGPISGWRALGMINAYTVAFFNQALRERPSRLLDGPSADYAEIRFEKR